MEGITPDIILNDNIGRECKTDSVEEFARIVERIFTERRVEQIPQDITHLLQKFDIKNVAQKYKSLFLRLESNRKIEKILK